MNERNNKHSKGDSDMNIAVFGGMEMLNNPLPTPTSFSKNIERMALEKGLSFIEACLYWCEENGMEPEDVSHLINNSLRDKIRAEAEQKNFLKKPNTLPL